MSETFFIIYMHLILHCQATETISNDPLDFDL